MNPISFRRKPSHYRSASSPGFASPVSALPQMVNRLFGVLGRRARSVITKVKGREMSADAMMRKKMDVEVVEELADLNLLSAGIYRGCMGLPQELIDDIINVLHDDPRALRACSLTCRAMFASTRRLIHQTLHLTRRNHKPALVSLRMEGDERHISYLADRDLLRYTRQLHIHDSCEFSPGALGPHLYRFRQSLNRVHTLIIEGYDAIRWANLHKPCFIHLYSTLTSLTLIRPFGHCQLILQFALQFPNLENLCLERPYNRRFGPYVAVPAVADKFPPLRGHLRLVGLEPEAVGLRLADFTRELQMGMNFRSVELEGHLNGRSYTQQILNACASTVTDLTITPHGNGYLGLRYLNFKGIAGLRRLTLRTAFTPVFGVAFGFIPISTITSPVFRQLVLELGGIPSRFDGPSLVCWGRWGEIDRLIVQRFVEDGDFRFTIRTGKLHDHEAFQKHAKEAFPLLASRGCIYFEISSSIGNVGSDHLRC